MITKHICSILIVNSSRSSICLSVIFRIQIEHYKNFVVRLYYNMKYMILIILYKFLREKLYLARSDYTL